MSKKTKIVLIIYFIVLGIILFNTTDLSKLTNNLEYIACGSATKIPKPYPQLTTVIYTLLITATPLVLIVMSIITLVKAITSGNIEEVSKAKSKLLKKIIITVIIFLVAGIVQFVLNKVTTTDDDRSTMLTCLKCFLYFDEKSCPIVEYDADIVVTPHHRSYTNRAKPVPSDNNASKSNKSSSSNNNGPTGNSNVIIVGDSRTVQFCNVKNNTYTKEEYNAESCGFFTAVAKGGKTASWFKDTAINNVNNILNKDTSKKYTIVILMGANDVGVKSGAELNAVNTYKTQLSSLATGAWKNHEIKFAKTTCGDEAMAKSQRYPMYISQPQIDSFNRQIKEFINEKKLNNLHYCDIEDVPRKYLSDGVHYTPEGSNFYYDQVKNKCS